MVPLLLAERLDPRLEVEAPRDRRLFKSRLDARLHALEAAQLEVGAAREALEELVRALREPLLDVHLPSSGSGLLP